MQQLQSSNAGKLLATIKPGRAVMAGLAGGFAYLIEQSIDLRVFRVNVDDIQLLGRFFSSNPRVWPAIGLAIHCFNAISLACVYALLGRYLPGPGWLRGIIFAQIENTLLWPITLILDRYHPGRKAGTLAAYNAPVPFLQGILRHLAYGAVLGLLYPFHRR